MKSNLRKNQGSSSSGSKEGSSGVSKKLLSLILAVVLHAVLLLGLTVIIILPERPPPEPMVTTMVDAQESVQQDRPREEERVQPASVIQPAIQPNILRVAGQAEIVLPEPVLRETPPGLGTLQIGEAAFSGRLQNGKVALGGLSESVSEWASGGQNGIGISGRGKTLKTINEFWCYYVIYSGDWYAALDWKEAPDSRQVETSYPGLPDTENMGWFREDPGAYPGMGPFLAYYYGWHDYNGQQRESRSNTVEFTPGAMSNLLRFLRVASNQNIKGGAKPKAVVLDRSLLPYTYEKASGTMLWHPEGRESLREKLRKNLPPGGKYGIRGYLWNPQPEDPRHMDFDVEYLLDIRPMPPFIFLSGNDDFTFTETEVETLRAYLARGGAIWADSGFAGHRSKFDVSFRREMARILPGEEYRFRRLPNQQGNPFLSGPDAFFDLEQLPYGMQYYQAPMEVIEIVPGVVSVLLTKNAYGNFLRFRTAFVNNQFQVGGEIDRGQWAQQMWRFREEFFRGLGDENIEQSYALASNILVYMLGRWPQALKMGKLEGLN
jgi:hypothetical protein